MLITYGTVIRGYGRGNRGFLFRAKRRAPMALGHTVRSVRGTIKGKGIKVGLSPTGLVVCKGTGPMSTLSIFNRCIVKVRKGSKGCPASKRRLNSRIPLNRNGMGCPTFITGLGRVNCRKSVAVRHRVSNRRRGGSVHVTGRLLSGLVTRWRLEGGL